MGSQGDSEAGATRHSPQDCNVEPPQRGSADLDFSQRESASVSRRRGIARLPVGKKTRRRGKPKKAETRPAMLLVEEEPVLLTRAQAAKLAQVSLSKLDQWSREPDCPVIREGHHFVRFHRDDFVVWLAQRTRQQRS